MVQVTVVSPRGNFAGASLLTVSVKSHVSLTVGDPRVGEVPVGEVHSTLSKLAGAVMFGFVVSTTLTVKLQLPTLFVGEASSLAEQVTVLLPKVNDEPEMGEHPFEVARPQLSAPTVAAANVAVAPLGPVHSFVTFVGQVMGGGVLSTTVTVPVQEVGLSQLSFGVTVKVTEVIPLL